jgi:hypothetical protein
VASREGSYAFIPVREADRQQPITALLTPLEYYSIAIVAFSYPYADPNAPLVSSLTSEIFSNSTTGLHFIKHR